ncbi:IS3 family transposase [Mycoplasmopsis agassizii]
MQKELEDYIYYYNTKRIQKKQIECPYKIQGCIQ